MHRTLREAPQQRLGLIDAEVLKKVHRKFPTGVTVVSTLDEAGNPKGLAVNAFASVSLEPPLVLVCISRNSATHPHFFRNEYFSTSILAADQIDVARRFAQSGGDKYAGLAWAPGVTGVPVLEGASATLELKIEDRAQAPTHTVLVGRVVHATVCDRRPLLYMNAEFFDPSAL